MNKLKILWNTDRESRKLLVESYIYMAWARYLKSIPFSKVAPSLGLSMKETSIDPHRTNRKVLALVSQSIHTMSKYTFWESQCLVKAIAAMKMLEKRKIESTLYLGTGKDENGKLIAHAWLRSGPYYVTGAEGMERFTVVGKFAKTLGGTGHDKGN